MNQVIENIGSRRSVRSFAPKALPADALNAILESGNRAPSGAGNRCWRFVVVQDQEFRNTLAALAKPRYERWLANMPDSFKALRATVDNVNPDPAYYGAPAIVFVIGWGMTCQFDCPMVCENMMLAARSLEIGSCWVYIGQLVLDDPGVRQALELKPSEKVFGPILLGYPSQGFPVSPDLSAPVVKFI